MLAANRYAWIRMIVLRSFRLELLPLVNEWSTTMLSTRCSTRQLNLFCLVIQYLTEVMTALISSWLICSGSPRQHQPQTSFHFQALLGTVWRNCWCRRSGSLALWIMRSSPFTDTSPAIRAASDGSGWGGSPSRRRGGRCSIPCKVPARPGVSWSTTSWMLMGSIRPKSWKRALRSIAITGTDQEFPSRVLRMSSKVLPTRWLLGMQCCVWSKGKPRMTSRSAIEATRTRPSAWCKQYSGLYW